MSVEDALQEVLKKALIHDGLARGLRESAKALDRRNGPSLASPFATDAAAHLAVLNESCTEPEYVKLIEALCAEHRINLISACGRSSAPL